MPHPEPHRRRIAGKAPSAYVKLGRAEQRRTECMETAKTRRSESPIAEALARLPEADRVQVLAAFDVGGSFRYSWPDRYKAADLALRAVGAVRVPNGRRRRETFYRMPCGCAIKLDYARPWLFMRCAQHPAAPLELADLGRTFERVVRGVGAVAVGATIIGSGVATLASFGMLVTGGLKETELRVVWYWLVFAIAVAWILWQRRSHRKHQSDTNGPA